MKKENCLLCKDFWSCKNRNEKYVCRGYESEEEQLPKQMELSDVLN